MTAKINGDYKEKHCKAFFNCMSELNFNIETKEKTKKTVEEKWKHIHSRVQVCLAEGKVISIWVDE